MAAFCTGPDGRAGQWLLERRLVDQVGGFNEVLLGYGFDDKDFRSRVEAQGVAVHRAPAMGKHHQESRAQFLSPLIEVLGRKQ